MKEKLIDDKIKKLQQTLSDLVEVVSDYTTLGVKHLCSHRRSLYG